MDEVPEARELSTATVEEVLGLVEPTWEVTSVRRAERGFSTVYRIDLDGDDPELYLKASPDGGAWGIPVEARLQAVLCDHTSIPVPEVLGALDEHERLPTPSYVMRAMPGEELPYEHVVRFDDGSLRRLARETGQYLAELHSLPVDGFGHVRHRDADRRGGRPSGAPSSLTVDEASSWPAFLREYVERELDRHGDGRFADLTAEIERWVDAGIEGLDGPFDAVLGRNDHGLHNLLVDPTTGEITAMLDWGYTLAVPRAFDVEFAIYLYSGAFLAGLPDASDRRTLVREAVVDGYRRVDPAAAAEIATPTPLYELIAMLRIMNDFQHLDVPAESERRVEERIRTDAMALLEDDPLG